MNDPVEAFNTHQDIVQKFKHDLENDENGLRAVELFFKVVHALHVAPTIPGITLFKKRRCCTNSHRTRSLVSQRNEDEDQIPHPQLAEI